jgi:hypothetical protein
LRNLFRFGYVAALFGVYEDRPKEDLRAPYRQRVKSLRMTYEDLDNSVKGKLDRTGLYHLSTELEKRSMLYRIHTPAPGTPAPQEPPTASLLEHDIARLRDKIFGPGEEHREP